GTRFMLELCLLCEGEGLLLRFRISRELVEVGRDCKEVVKVLAVVVGEKGGRR
nr:hypothetical protein [Tanacetum cinerariifolium]